MKNKTDWSIQWSLVWNFWPFWKGSICLFCSSVQVSLDFSKLSNVFSRCLNIDLWAVCSSRIKYIILWHISVKKSQLGMERQHHWKESFIKAITPPLSQLNSSYVTLLYIQLENSPLKKVILWEKFQLVRQSVSSQEPDALTKIKREKINSMSILPRQKDAWGTALIKQKLLLRLPLHSNS